MTLEDLISFIDSKMRMSHVYQPLLIRALVDTGGSATLRRLVQTFVQSFLPSLLKRILEVKKFNEKPSALRGIDPFVL